MRILVLALIVSLIGFSATAQQPVLQDYHKAAIDSSPALKAAYNKYEIALERVPQVSALPDPALSFAYGLSPVETRLGPQQAKISLTQMFPWFGTLNAKEKQAAMLAQAAYEDYVLQRNTITYKVSTTWYDLYFFSRSISITKKQIQLLTMLEHQASTKFENNKASMVDILRFQMSREELEEKLIFLNDQMKTTTTKFNMLLNRDATTEVNLIDSLRLPATKSYAIDSILQNNPQIKTLEANFLASQHQIEAAQKSGYPSIGLGLDYSFIGKRTDMQVEGSGTDVIMPMLSISIPLYRKKYKAQANEAVLNSARIAHQQNELRNTLQVNYEQAMQNYNAALRNVQLYKRLTETANKAFNILQTGYATSSENYVQLLDIQNTVLKYQINYDKAVSDLYIAIAYLEYLAAR